MSFVMCTHQIFYNDEITDKMGEVCETRGRDDRNIKRLYLFQLSSGTD
jgi:hypothetical protein